jgi:site-specific recombinase XerD
MRIRNDVSVTFNKARKKWLVRWHGKFDPETEKQPRFCKTFKRKRDAERFAQSLKTDIHDGISTEPKTINLENLCNKFIESKKNKRPNTVRSYKETVGRLISSFGGHRNIKTISSQDASSFINNLELLEIDKDPSDSTRLKHLTNSKIIFNQAIKWQYIRNNPFKDISITDISKEDWHFITPAEFKSLITAIDNIKLNNKMEQQDKERKIRLKAFYSVMYGCGLRFGEAVHLFWDKNIDFINSTIHIKNRTSKNGYPPFSIKNHQDRSTPAPKWVMDTLEELKKVSNKKNPYVFITDDRLKLIKSKWAEFKDADEADKWLNGNMVNNTNRNFVVNCKRAGIVTSDKLSVHCLRKGYGTNLADLGTPVHTLKCLMAHANIETTMKFYNKNSDANSMKAVRGLEGLMGG